MFYPEKIQLLEEDTKVLDVGPGSDPHPRASVLLELQLSDEELAAQRGHTPPLTTDKKVVYYNGGKFPFSDKAFDYVICAHVIEHVTNVEEFVAELMRVAKRGYIEFPTAYYEYLYNFDVHVNYVLYDAPSNEIRYLPKEESAIETFLPIHSFFYRTLQQGYTDIIDDLKKYMIVGFEWSENFPPKIKRMTRLEDVLPPFLDLEKKVSEPEPSHSLSVSAPSPTNPSFLNRIFKKFLRS